jgi:hypothetical protein
VGARRAIGEARFTVAVSLDIALIRAPAFQVDETTKSPAGEPSW